MLTVTKKNLFITEEGDKYSISSLIVNDALSIELDKPLHIKDRLFVAGPMVSNTNITVGANVHLGSESILNSIDCNLAFVCLGTLAVHGNLTARGNIEVDTLKITGNIIGNKSVVIKKSIESQKGVSAGSMLVVGGNADIKGKVVAGKLIDVRGIFSFRYLAKVAGQEFLLYSRVIYNGDIYFLYDEVMIVCTKGKKVENPILKPEEKANDANFNFVYNIMKGLQNKGI